MARLYNGKTWDEMNAIYTKQDKDLTPEERAYLAGLTKEDYDAYVMEKNSATARPGEYYLNGGEMQQYTGWNGGSVTGADMWAAVQDSLDYGYDITLDPRNNAGASEAIGNTLLDASEQANLDAIAGKGDYATNYQNYLDQIGWTDYQDVFRNLQQTGSLGLNNMEGKPIEQAYELGNPNFVWTGGDPEYVANVNLATGERNDQSSQQPTQNNVIDVTMQPIAGIPNVAPPPPPAGSELPAGTQQTQQPQQMAGTQNQNAAYQSEYLQQLQQMMPTMPEGYQSQYTQQLQQAPTMPEGYQSQYSQQLQQAPTMPEGYQSQNQQALQQAPTMPEGYQSQYTQQLQQTPTMPEAYQSQYAQQLQQAPTMPEAYQSQYTQQLQQAPTMPEAYQSQYAQQLQQTPTMPEAYQSQYTQQLQQAPTMPEAYQSQYAQQLQQAPTMPEAYQSQYTQQLQQMPTMQTPEQSQYYEQMMQALNVPQANAPDLSGLEALLNLPEGYEVAPYEGNLNALQQTPEQQEAYKAQLQALQEQYKMPEATPFTYDPATDPIYQAYLQQFTRDANQGMRDTLGQISARTGGLASSYAGQAAQQTYNEYMKQAADILPAMNEAAYNRWLNEQQMARSENADAYNRALQMLDRQTAADQTAWEQQAFVEQQNYQRYLDELTRQMQAQQAEWERQAMVEGESYNRQQNAYNQQLAANQLAFDRLAQLDATEYARQLDAINLQNAYEQEAYNRALTQEQLGYQQYLNNAEMQMALEQEAYNRLLNQENMDYQRYLNDVNLRQQTEQEAYDRALTQEQLAYQKYLNDVNLRQQTEQEAYNRALTQEQLAYQQYLNNVDLQRATEQEAYDRALTQEQLAYQQYLNNADMEWRAQQEAYDRALTQEQLEYQQYLNNANMQQQIEQEAYNRALTQEQLAYQQYLNNVDLQRATEQEAYDRALTQEQLAYQQYLNNAEMQRATEQETFDRLAQLENFNYGMYQDELQRQLNAEQTAWERQAYLDELNYARQQDAIDRQTAADQTAWERQIYSQQMAADQQTQNANLLLSLMESYGYQPTAQELAAAGLSQGMANAVGNAYQNQLAMQWANINNKGSSGGTGDVPQATDYLNVLQSAGVKDAGTAAFMLVNAGMKVSDAETLASYYMDILEQQGPNGGNNAPQINLEAELEKTYDGTNGKTLGDYTAAAENRRQVEALASQARSNGISNKEIQDMIRDMYRQGALNPEDLVYLLGVYS